MEELCLITFELSEPSGTVAVRPSRQNFNFDSPIDFTRSRNGREYIFKHQGLVRFRENGVTFSRVDSSGAIRGSRFYGTLKLDPSLHYDVDGRVHVRALSKLLSKGERRHMDHELASRTSSLGLMADPSFHAYYAVMGAVTAGLGCDVLDSDCAGDILDGAVVSVAEASGGLVGGAAGSVAGAVAGGYAAGAALLATGLACPWCVPLATSLGSALGGVAGRDLGGRLVAGVAQWISARVLRRFLGFLQRLAGLDGKHAAVRELELGWHDSSSCDRIREQRRRVIKKSHPDICRTAQCKEKSLRINAAADRLMHTCAEEDLGADDDFHGFHEEL